MLRQFHLTIPELRVLDSLIIVYSVKLEIATWKSMGTESLFGDCLKWPLKKLQLCFPALGGFDESDCV